ncbi:hypothetical protein LCGC14_0148470 [marine sediment metagenome]|uniref:Uncharacterized protein n=1 Tax=marine sediment metagenome TaxID=412755 RepID=A0A0F9Y103_9ZZZZ
MQVEKLAFFFDQFLAFTTTFLGMCGYGYGIFIFCRKYLQLCLKGFYRNLNLVRVLITIIYWF